MSQTESFLDGKGKSDSGVLSEEDAKKEEYLKDLLPKLGSTAAAGDATPDPTGPNPNAGPAPLRPPPKGGPVGAKPNAGPAPLRPPPTGGPFSANPSNMPKPAGFKVVRKQKTYGELDAEMKKNWATENPVDKIAEHRASSIPGARLPEASKGVVASRPKKAFLDSKTLAGVNDDLAKAGSFFRMEQVGKPDADGFVEVRPVFDAGDAPVPFGHRFISELNNARRKEDGAEDGLVAWADCHKMSQMVMGAADTKEVLVIPGPDGPERVVPVDPRKALEIPGIKNSEASRMMHTLLGNALPKFAKTLDTLVDGFTDPAEKKRAAERAKAIKAAIEAAEEARGSGSEATKAPLCGRSAYGEIVPKDDPPDPVEEKIYEEFCKAYGLNSYAIPNVGDAFTIVNDETQLKNRKDEIQRLTIEREKLEEEGKDASHIVIPPDVWNFHWAGVVKVNPDGTYMTLENTSTENQLDVNDDWYYAVYDPKAGKDFHSVHMKDKAIMKNAITVLVTNGARN